MIGHVISFGLGFCTGWLAKSMSIGEDPNTIWENSKKAATDAGTAVADKATEVKDTVAGKVTEIKNNKKAKKAAAEVVNPDGTPAN